jgi:hypothetical protein
LFWQARLIVKWKNELANLLCFVANMFSHKAT